MTEKLKYPTVLYSGMWAQPRYFHLPPDVGSYLSAGYPADTMTGVEARYFISDAGGRTALAKVLTEVNHETRTADTRASILTPGGWASMPSLGRLVTTDPDLSWDEVPAEMAAKVAADQGHALT